MLLLAAVPPASAYEIAAFDCCHVGEVAPAAVPMAVVVVPIADRRGPLLDHPDEAAKWARQIGIVRGGYGNPWNLWSDRDTRDYVTDAIAAHLSAAGLTVEIADGSGP